MQKSEILPVGVNVKDGTVGKEKQTNKLLLNYSTLALSGFSSGETTFMLLHHRPVKVYKSLQNISVCIHTLLSAL